MSDDWSYNLDAEQCLLAAMMDGRDGIQAVEEIAEIVGPDDFYRPAHQSIFLAVVAMRAAQEPVTPVTLRAWLERDGVGPRQYGGDKGPLYLAELFGLPVPGVMGPAHARIVWECAVRRKIAEAGARMRQFAGDLAHSPDELIGESQSVLTALAKGAQQSREGSLSADAFLELDTSRTAPVIPGLLDHEDRVVIVGFEGHGKTTLSHQVAFTGAAGIHPFVWSQPITPVRALIIDLENPKGILQRRFAKYREIASRYPGWHPDNVRIWTAPGGVNLERATDAFRMSEQVRDAQPDLLIVGPVGKMIQERERAEHLHGLVMDWCDQMRQRYGCAIWVEHHAPLKTGPGKRELRPRGSGKWSSWPEFGLALEPGKPGSGTLTLGRFRGDREEGRTWPESITRNNTPGGWPWVARYPEHTFMQPIGEAS